MPPRNKFTQGWWKNFFFKKKINAMYATQINSTGWHSVIVKIKTNNNWLEIFKKKKKKRVRISNKRFVYNTHDQLVQHGPVSTSWKSSLVSHINALLIWGEKETDFFFFEMSHLPCILSRDMWLMAIFVLMAM